MIAYGHEPDALDPFRDRDADRPPAPTRAPTRADLALAALVWGGAAAALVWRLLG